MIGLEKILDNATNAYKGIAAAPGLYMGEAYIYSKENVQINSGQVENLEEAIAAFHEAMSRSKKEMMKIFSYAKEKMGEKRATIFEAQLMILDDPVLNDLIVDRVKNELIEPQEIVRDEFDQYRERLMYSKDPFFKERADDLDDIKLRIIRNLQKKKWVSKIKNDVIVVSELLTSADTILFSKNNVGAYVTVHGGITSHTAIIARSLNIPAVVGIADATESIKSGDYLIVDGFDGLVFVNPSQTQIEFFKNKIQHLKEINKQLEGLKDKPAVTLDGYEITLLSNVDVSSEIDSVLYCGSKGIGLYRTEQIIEELGEFPDEEQQVALYTSVSEKLYPFPATIRAFDLGGDKVRMFHHKEENPFLGLRGIRFLLENKPMFKKQIRAILRSNMKGNLKFMIPMISIFEELIATREIISTCIDELRAENINHNPDLKLGIMVEVPSVAVLAADFAKEVDFLSVGTNDLIQYLMAVDRGNDIVQDLYQEFNLAVLRTLQHIVNGGKAGGASVSICGAMAADSLAVPLLVAMGFDSLSVTPTAVPSVKRIITSMNFNSAKQLLDKCLMLKSQDLISNEIEAYFKEYHIDRTRHIL